MDNRTTSEFEKAVAGGRTGNVLGDFVHFLMSTKKWWILPIVLVLAMLGALMLAGGTAAAPFIYTLF